MRYEETFVLQGVFGGYLPWKTKKTRAMADY